MAIPRMNFGVSRLALPREREQPSQFDMLQRGILMQAIGGGFRNQEPQDNSLETAANNMSLARQQAGQVSMPQATQSQGLPFDSPIHRAFGVNP